jgi:hypothetical protein
MGSYAGIDWASEKDDVLIADEHGGQLLAETFMHDEQGIVALCDALSCFEVDVVAIERGDGVLVERLLEAGCGCWRCIPIRSRPRAIGSAPRAGSPTGSTASCCASSPEPTRTASGSWNLIRIRPRRCER